MTLEEETFVRAATELSIGIGPDELEAFRSYYRQLVDWNKKVNLTAITSYPDVLFRHFLDSLTLAPLVREAKGTDIPEAPRLVDVGTGAGFPGVPLLLAGLTLRVTLVDSVGKKTDFCRYISEALGLTGVSVVTARAEELGRDPQHRGHYDMAVSRAVDNLAALAEYLLPLCRIGGLAIAMKKGMIDEEIERAAGAWGLLGGALKEVRPVADLPGLEDNRVLVVIEKVAPTPEDYPRRPGVPHKHPLGTTYQQTRH